jgi:hypothetical protein
MSVCTCAHLRSDHYAERGQCMTATPDETWACDCAEYRGAADVILGLMKEALTCPRCGLVAPDGWCCICGDAYPWPRRDEPYNFAKPYGISQPSP